MFTIVVVVVGVGIHVSGCDNGRGFIFLTEDDDESRRVGLGRRLKEQQVNWKMWKGNGAFAKYEEKSLTLSTTCLRNAFAVSPFTNFFFLCVFTATQSDAV